MRFKRLGIAILVSGLLVAAAGAMTTDEYYDRASQKYVIGDLDGAAADLHQSLAIDSTNNRSRDLLMVINREKGVGNPPAASPVAPAPTQVEPETYQPKPAPPARSDAPARKVVRKKYVPPPPPVYPPTILPEPAPVKEATLWLAAGKEYLLNGEYKQALTEFNKVLRAHPGHPLATQYARKAKKVLYPAKPAEVPVVVPTPAASAPLGPKLEVYLLIGLELLMLGVLFSALFFAVRFITGLLRGRYVACPECGARCSERTEFCPKCGGRIRVWQMTDSHDAWFKKFNWRQNPFTLEITPNTFTGHKLDIATILEKLSSHSGHIMLIGGLGTGKTTLLRWLEGNLKGSFMPIYVVRPVARPEDLIDMVVSVLSKTTNRTRKYSTYEFQEFCGKYKGTIVLLIDEAHELTEDFEQFLRTLGDLNNVFLVMAGLPQVREKLKRELPGLFDRIAETILLGALSYQETAEMIQKRIAHAGGSGFGPFSASAIEKIHEMSFGIPRGILKICDWAVTQAVEVSRNIIDASDVIGFNALAEIKRKEKAEGGS